MYEMKFQGINYKCRTIGELVEIHNNVIDNECLRSSDLRVKTWIKKDGKKVCEVSYNGRLWIDSNKFIEYKA